MFQNQRKYQLMGLLLVVLVVVGLAKFYHYNYVANARGQARTLKLPGLQEFVCKGKPYIPAGVDQCGGRSIYMDPDWGVTAYFTVYGIETKAEAEALATFMLDSRVKSKQEGIPINLVIYSVPRSAGVRPNDFKILDGDF